MLSSAMSRRGFWRLWISLSALRFAQIRDESIVSRALKRHSEAATETGKDFRSKMVQSKMVHPCQNATIYDVQFQVQDIALQIC